MTKKTKRTATPKPTPKPAVRDPASHALKSVVAILRPLPADKRRQVMRSVAAFYGDVPAP